MPSERCRQYATPGTEVNKTQVCFQSRLQTPQQSRTASVHSMLHNALRKYTESVHQYTKSGKKGSLNLPYDSRHNSARALNDILSVPGTYSTCLHRCMRCTVSTNDRDISPSWLFRSSALWSLVVICFEELLAAPSTVRPASFDSNTLGCNLVEVALNQPFAAPHSWSQSPNFGITLFRPQS